MATQAQRRQWREAVEAALNERDAAERYRLRQRESRRGAAAAAERARPLEFDDRGFPIPQRVPSMLRRVAWLLGRE